MILVLVRMLVRLIAVGLAILRLLLPIVVRIMVHLLILEVTCTLALFRGVRETVDIMAQEWQRSTHVHGLDPRLDRMLFHVFRVLAFVALCTGWVLMAALTLVAVNLIAQ